MILITWWSGKRDLNPRLQPWQGCTLPLSYSRNIEIYTIGAARLSTSLSGPDAGSPAQAKEMESPLLTVPPLITLVNTPCSGMMHSPTLLYIAHRV
jgi:hypothetical protein